MKRPIVYKLSATLLLLLAAWLFWWWGYTCALSFHEQLQLFQFGSSYFVDSVGVPGGLASYVSEFLVQFYFIPVAGAAVIAVAYVVIQLLSWAMMRKLGAADGLYPLSFVSSLLLWGYMGDENVLLSFAVAVIAVQLVALGWMRIGNAKVRVAAMIVGIPLCYWLFGSAVFSLVLFAVIYELTDRQASYDALLREAAYVIVVVASVLASAQVVQYPLSRLFVGLNYYRFAETLPYVQLAIMVVVAVVPFVRIPRPSLITPRSSLLAFIVIALSGAGFIRISFDKTKYELIEYDYLVRTAQWTKIVEKAQDKSPDLPMSVASLNLALYETGQLPDRMFEFFQNGTEGLFPAYTRDFTSPLSTAEIFLRLGMVNTAQRYMFEAQEAIPNYCKSARMTKRLAETNLINGQYEVAGKYLRMLKRTLFYKEWAEEASTYLHNDGKVASHPFWGKLRQYSYSDDFLFSDGEMDQMLGLLIVKCGDNRMAYEYLMAYVLLRRDMDKFIAYYPLGKDLGYSHIPRSYQEALLFQWTKNHRNFNGLPYSISPEVMREVNTFGGIYQRNHEDPALKQGVLASCYWSYLLN